MWAWIVVIVVAGVLGYAVWTFNRLVGLTKRADAAWSDIDVQLKRRWDLVPALVETVKGYAQHESSTLERVVAARGQAVQPASIPERGEREQIVIGGREPALRGGRGLSRSESHPELSGPAAQPGRRREHNPVRSSVLQRGGA